MEQQSYQNQNSPSEIISSNCVSQPTPMTPHPLAGFTSWPLVAVKCYMAIPSASISYLQQMLHKIWHIISANNFYLNEIKINRISLFLLYHLYKFGYKPTEVMANPNYKANLSPQRYILDSINLFQIIFM